MLQLVRTKNQALRKSNIGLCYDMVQNCVCKLGPAESHFKAAA